MIRCRITRQAKTFSSPLKHAKLLAFKYQLCSPTVATDAAADADDDHDGGDDNLVV